MPRFIKRSAIAAICISSLLPSFAMAFDKIESREAFVQTVQGKDLKLTGISVNVTPAGEITGRAYGVRVRGEWQWQNGYFCRSLFWGRKDLGPNCQEVRVDGDTIRFTSDRGSGQFADLTMR